MKGGREAWVFILLISLFAGLGMLIEGGVTGLGVGAVLGGVLAFLLRTWLVKLCKAQLERLYTPLTQSLADADALTAHCRVKVAAEFKEERKRIAARRDEDLKRVEDNYRKAFAAAESPPRRKAAQDQRGLRRANGRGPDDPRARHARAPSTPTTAAWPSCEAMSETGYPKLDEKYKAFKERIRSEHETAWNALAEPLARRHEPGRRRARRGQPRGRRLLPRLERPGLAVAIASQAGPARDSLREDPARARLAAAAESRPRRLDGRRADVVSPSRPCGHFPRAPTC